MAYLIQLILPVYDNEGQRFTAADSQKVRTELLDRFGGVTAYVRAPAEGLWEDPNGRTHRDDVVTIEVMSEEIDRAWWAQYLRDLAVRFRQKEIAARAIAFITLGDFELPASD